MRIIPILTAFLIVAIGASAQDIPDWDIPTKTISADGMHIVAYGEKLTRLETRNLFMDTPAWLTYRMARSQYVTGKIFIWVGVPPLLVGAVGAWLSEVFYMENSTYLIPLVAGLGLVGGGIALKYRAKRNVAKSVDLYLENQYGERIVRPTRSELSLGFTPAGVGLALKF